MPPLKTALLLLAGLLSAQETRNPHTSAADVAAARRLFIPIAPHVMAIRVRAAEAPTWQAAVSTTDRAMRIF